MLHLVRYWNVTKFINGDAVPDVIDCHIKLSDVSNDDNDVYDNNNANFHINGL